MCQKVAIVCVKAHLHIPFTHVFSALHCIFDVLTLVYLCLWNFNVISSKTQRNAENACLNGMWQLGLNVSLIRQRHNNCYLVFNLDDGYINKLARSIYS